MNELAERRVAPRFERFELRSPSDARRIERQTMGLHVLLSASAKMSGRSRELPTTVLLVSRFDLSGLLCGQMNKGPIARLDNSRRGRSQSPRRASALQLQPCIRCVLHTDAGVRQSAIHRGQGRRRTGCQYGFGTRCLHRVHSSDAARLKFGITTAKMLREALESLTTAKPLPAIESGRGQRIL